MKQESFEERLNRKTEGFSLTPREGLWEDIEKELVPEKRKKRGVVFFLFSGILAVLTIALFGLFNTTSNKGAIAKGHKTVKNEVFENSENSTAIPADINAAIADEKKMQGGQQSYWGSFRSVESEHVYPERQNSEGYKSGDIASLNLTNIEERELVDISTNSVNEGNKGEPESSDGVVDLQENIIVPVTVEQLTDTVKKNMPVIGMSVKPVNTRFYLGLVLTPLQSYASLSLNSQGSQAMRDYTGRSVTDKPGAGFIAGLNAGVEKGRHQLSTGVQFCNLGYRMLLKNVETKVPAGSAVVNTTKVASRDSFISTNADNGGSYYTAHYNFISIPLGYMFRLTQGKAFNLGLTGTLTYNRLLNSNALLYDEQGGYFIRKQASGNNNLRKNSYMVSSGFSVNYHPKTNLSFFMQPQLGITLGDIEKGAISTRLKYWGVGLGVRWYLR